MAPRSLTITLAGFLAMACASSVFAQTTPAATPAPAPTREGLVSIFNGKDLTGWKVPNPNLWWKVIDGVLVGENDPALRGNNLFTDKIYKDVEFECEYRYAAEGDIDTGVHLRQPLIEIQMGRSRTLRVDMTGSVFQEGTGGGYVGISINGVQVYKPGEWNKLHFIAKKDVLDIWLNDTHVLTTSLAKYPGPYPLGLEVHNNVKMRVEFRNLYARSL